MEQSGQGGAGVGLGLLENASCKKEGGDSYSLLKKWAILTEGR